MKAALTVVLLVFFVPLFLALLFLMPLEFLVSSWHLRQVQATTSGMISRAEITTHRGAARSDVEYSYRIGGRDYTSTRLRAGLVSNRGFEAGAGEFSRQHPVGTTVQVHYAPDRPAFAIVEYGWPKWSVGFSLGVWGLVVGCRFRVARMVRRSQTVSFALVRAIAVAGFLTLLVMDTTITPSGMLVVVAFYGGAFLVLLGYANLKFKAIGGPGAAPQGGPATPVVSSRVSDGPPSVSRLFDLTMNSLLSVLFGQGRKEKQVWDTTPGGPYEVTITDQELTCTHLGRPKESIRWDQVREIMLVTTSEGPLLPDVWYVFTGDGTGCSVPSEAKGFDQLWDVFKSRFPTIDYQAMIGAGTDDERKVIWRK